MFMGLFVYGLFYYDLFFCTYMFLFDCPSVQMVLIASHGDFFGGIRFNSITVVILNDVVVDADVAATAVLVFRHDAAGGVAFNQAAGDGDVVGSGQQHAKPSVTGYFAALDDSVGAVCQRDAASGKRRIETAIADADVTDILKQHVVEQSRSRRDSRTIVADVAVDDF
jgi:hypothetical protein